ncbi:hypothetical protein RHMOL_Rhmol08G0016400 [Rhododendron molle]|uniref:Uncharacterized protein n=1 Tax=Rhododendron molle TaxID=49168 RepID=A0ACC0MJQ7_RHOML|nr:hypothetical protein RHMOL_Rhmol08G0016400 [Rhododendron molle]
MRVSLLLLVLLLTAPPFAVAQTAPDPPTYYPNSDLNSTAELIFVIVVAAFLTTGFVSVCIHQCYNGDTAGGGAIPLYTAASRPRRLSPSGLDPAVMNSFPIFNYSEIKHLKLGKGELSCAVCVSEFEDSERLRWLPKCDHVFHPECIDLWLASHSTCPICRANLSQGIESTQSTEACNSTAEILFREVQNQSDQIALEVDENHRVDTEPRERARVMFPRPHSTGHSLVRLGEDCERYMLRLPEELRRQVDRGGTPDRWFFTMTQPCFSRTGSQWLAKVGFVDGEVTAIGTSKVFPTSVKSPFESVAGENEQMSSGLPV